MRAQTADRVSDAAAHSASVSLHDEVRTIESLLRGMSYPLDEESALKLVYMAIDEASKKWTQPIPKWREPLNHFAIIFEDRLPNLGGN